MLCKSWGLESEERAEREGARGGSGEWGRRGESREELSKIILLTRERASACCGAAQKGSTGSTATGEREAQKFCRKQRARLI
jgi:hypothetical protein